MIKNIKLFVNNNEESIIPGKRVISIVPEVGKRDLIVTIDGENNFYNNVDSIETIIDSKKIKCLRLGHYNFPQKINEKLLMD